jgi:hypothetical protein
MTINLLVDLRYPGFQSLRDVSIYYLLSKALKSRVDLRKLQQQTFLGGLFFAQF